MKFKVSIVTVVRNGEKTLQALIDSVAKYKTYDTEFMIWDGKSTDSTLDIIKANPHVIDQYFVEKDSGIYDAMNKAVLHAKGKWILFMGCDDLLMEGFSQMLKLMKNKDCIYYGGAYIGNELKSKPYTNYDLTRENICQQAIFYPAKVFTSYKYDTKYIACADYYLNVLLWNDPVYLTKFYDLIITKYALTGFSNTVLDRAYERDRVHWFEKYMPKLVFLRYLNRKSGLLKVIRYILFKEYS